MLPSSTSTANGGCPTSKIVWLNHETAAPAPVAASAQGSRFVTLPAEIIQRILEAAVPNPSWTTAASRSTLLRSLSLVKRSWSTWAQHELHRHVLLNEEVSIDLWLQTYDERSQSSNSSDPVRVQTLRNSGGSTIRVSPYRFAEIAMRLNGEHLRELWLATLRDVDLRQISGFQNLRKLSCVDLTLNIASNMTPTPIIEASLPKLEVLVLKDVDIGASVHTIFFQKHQFASLKILYVDSAEVLAQVFDEHDPASENIFPQLKVLSPAVDLKAAYCFPIGLSFLNIQDDFFGRLDWMDDLPPMPDTLLYLRFEAYVPSEDIVEFLRLIKIPNLIRVFVSMTLLSDPFWLTQLSSTSSVWEPRSLSLSEAEEETLHFLRHAKLTYETTQSDGKVLDLQDEEQPWEFMERAEWVLRTLRNT